MCVCLCDDCECVGKKEILCVNTSVRAHCKRSLSMRSLVLWILPSLDSRDKLICLQPIALVPRLCMHAPTTGTQRL